MSSRGLGALGRFALRRAAPIAWLGAACLVAWIAARVARPFEPMVALASEDGAADPESLLHAAARASAWTVFALAAGPVLLAAAARLGATLAGPAGGWLAARPVRPSSAAFALAGGVLAAGFVGCALGLCAAELGRSAGGPILARVGAAELRGETASAPWFDASRALRLEGIVPPRGAERLGLEVALGAGAPAARIDARLTSSSGASTLLAEHVLGRGELVLPLPEGGAPYALELSSASPRASVRALPATLTGWRVLGTERAASFALAARAASAAAWLVLALGLGAWLRASLAFACAASLFAATLLADAPAWLAGGGLASALELVARGRAPAPPGVPELAGAAALAVLGAALLAAGLARRRGDA